MALPLPRVVADVGPGGPFVTAARGWNALRGDQLANQIKSIEAQYAPQMTQAELAYKQAQLPYLQAQTKGLDISNQFAPERLRQANEYARLQNQFYGPNIQSEIASRQAQTQKTQQMTPLEVERLRLQNQFYPQLTQSQIESQKALSQYRQSGGAGMGVGQKEIQGFTSQLQNEHPDWSPQQVNQAASAYLSGNTVMPDGTELPELSGIGGSYVAQINKRGTTAAIQNQAANMDILVQDLEDFDIDAVKEMAGPQGRSRLLSAKAKMLMNPNDPTIDPMARRFLSSMNQAIINMDSMRKAFGTSVVPDYVYKTIGRLTNPSDSIFNDPIQIGKNYQTVVDSIKKQRDMITKKARFGATAQLGGKKTGSSKPVSQMTTEEIEQELAAMGNK